MLQGVVHSAATDRMGETVDPERGVRQVGGWCGILGSLLVAAYFLAPAFLDWPYGGASGVAITTYARSHAVLFGGGAWLQVTGTLLSVVFFLSVVHLARAASSLAGLVTVVAAAVLLATVVADAAFLGAVPTAAAVGDTSTADTLFALSNGAFVRVFPLAPASLTLIGVGLVLMHSGLFTRWLAYGALSLGVAFELAGAAAVMSNAGVVASIVLSVGQGLWALAAAITLLRSGPRSMVAASRSGR